MERNQARAVAREDLTASFSTKRIFDRTRVQAFRQLLLDGQQAAREDHRLHDWDPLLAVFDWYMAGRILVKSTASMETALVLLVAATSTILFYLVPVTNGEPFAVNLNFTLISAAVVFPVSFLIQSTFTRREKALLSMVGVKSTCTNLGLGFFVWDWSSPEKPRATQPHTDTHTDTQTQQHTDTETEQHAHTHQHTDQTRSNSISSGEATLPQPLTRLASVPELQEGLDASRSSTNMGRGQDLIETQQLQHKQRQKYFSNSSLIPEPIHPEQLADPDIVTSVKRSYTPNPPFTGRATSLDPHFNERALACLCRYLSGIHTILRLPTRNRTWNLHTKRGKIATAKLDLIQEELRRDSIQMYLRMTQLTLELKRAGMPAAEVSRMEQFVALLQKDTEHLIAIKNYRTPQSTRAFLRFFVLVLPMFYGVYYANIIVSSESSVSFVFGLLLSLVTAWVLTGLVHVQRTLEDPFVQSSTDGIRIGYEFNSVKQHLHEIVESMEADLPGGPHRHHEHHTVDDAQPILQSRFSASRMSVSDDFTT